MISPGTSHRDEITGLNEVDSFRLLMHITHITSHKAWANLEYKHILMKFDAFHPHYCHTMVAVLPGSGVLRFVADLVFVVAQNELQERFQRPISVRSAGAGSSGVFAWRLAL